MAGPQRRPESPGTWFSEFGGARRPRRTSARRIGLGDSAYRRQFAGRLGGLRAGSAAVEPATVTGIAPRRRVDPLEPGQVRGDREVRRGHAVLGVSPRLLGVKALRLPGTRQLSTLPISGDTRRGHRRTTGCHRPTTWRNCPAYFPATGQIAVGTPALSSWRRPAYRLTWCSARRDRVFPGPRSHRYFPRRSCRAGPASPNSRASGTSRCSRPRPGSPRPSTASCPSTPRAAKRSTRPAS